MLASLTLALALALTLTCGDWRRLESPLRLAHWSGQKQKMLSSFIFKTCDTIVVIVFVKALPERTGTVEKAAAASSSSRKPALTFLPHFCFLSQLPELMPAL